MSVAVVRLGVGNTASVMFALDRLGARATLTDDPARLNEAERVILPGVGAAATGMSRLAAAGLITALRSFPRPLLGLCLGQQLLFEASEEGDVAGLGLVAGRVRALASSPHALSPHMGWSRLGKLQDHPLLEGVPDGAYVYFVHSYICPLGPAAIARAAHGVGFAAAVAQGQVMGCQFHPERSGPVGALILANFLRLPC